MSPASVDLDGAAYDLDRYLYTFSAKTGKWDCLDVQAIPNEDGGPRGGGRPGAEDDPR